MREICLRLHEFLRMNAYETFESTDVNYKTENPGQNSRCTPQVGGAQRRSMVHNIVLYSLGDAQCRSHKPTQTHTQMDPFL